MDVVFSTVLYFAIFPALILIFLVFLPMIGWVYFTQKKIDLDIELDPDILEEELSEYPSKKFSIKLNLFVKLICFISLILIGMIVSFIGYSLFTKLV
jgi:hypothetical protein